MEDLADTHGVLEFFERVKPPDEGEERDRNSGAVVVFPEMKRLRQFVIAVLKKWGSLVTGGVLIGCVGIWQGTGHTVPAWVYAAIAAGGLLISFFKAWEEQIVSQLYRVRSSRTRSCVTQQLPQLL